MTDRGIAEAFLARRAACQARLAGVSFARVQRVTMHSEETAGVPENFPVEYQDKSGSIHPAELRGEGMLTLDPGEGVGVFTGTRRRMFGQPTSVTIRLEGISNVVVSGRRIGFDWREAGAKAKPKSFVFFCRDEPTALTIAGRLPTRLDEEFVAGRDFGYKLAARRMITGVSLLVVLGTVGFEASPRFNYARQEEAAWERAVAPALAGEHELLEQQKAVMAAFQNAGKSTELIQWMQEKAIPFYEKWIGDLNAMQLTAGRETAERRAVMVRLMRSKIENFRQLEFNVKMGDPDVLGRYRRAEDEALERASGKVGPASPSAP